MRALTRRHCDFLVHIPAVGRVASLNASAASAICLFEVVRQRNRMPPVSSG
jgi:23S rRNA (guanosine2251-2'-O)-methyltransferase